VEIEYVKQKDFLNKLKSTNANSLDFIIFSIYPFIKESIELTKYCIKEGTKVLNDKGILFIQGTPEYLTEIAEYSMNYLNFKYWIAIESIALKKAAGLPTAHSAVLIFTKNKNRFQINKVRFPHKYCLYCNKTLKDWGGKMHLMHPGGYAISDVWKDIPLQDNYTKISLPVLKTLLKMVNSGDGKGIVGPIEYISFTLHTPKKVSFKPSQVKTPSLKFNNEINEIEQKVLNKIYRGDALKLLKNIPDNSIDLAFADPPYNLEKSYTYYNDKQRDKDYVEWCNSWLMEYVRVLKPNGSLYVVNLPKWGVYHAQFLNKFLFLQNWIVWDAVSEPRGKIMPAHYALLFYTKHPTEFTFNYNELKEVDSPEFCLRLSCIRNRKEKGVDPKVALTDIWWDIHRIKHKKDRDMHPCQLPVKLLERVILLSSNQGDIVLDALCGTGTTLLVARKLKRRYIGIDIDKMYVEIARKKIRELEKKGYVERESEKRYKKEITKKELQLELKSLAKTLGRLPSEEDVIKMSKFDIKLFKKEFPTWGKALKAAKLEINNEGKTA
jgi:site-specific DNA-methyltransferase (adenine-specific)